MDTDPAKKKWGQNAGCVLGIFATKAAKKKRRKKSSPRKESWFQVWVFILYIYLFITIRNTSASGRTGIHSDSKTKNLTDLQDVFHMWRLCVCDPKFQVMFLGVSNGNHLRNNHGRLGGNIIVTSLQMSREKCQYQPIEIIRILHKKTSVPIPSPRILSSRYPFHDGNSDGNKKSKHIFGKKS